MLEPRSFAESFERGEALYFFVEYIFMHMYTCMAYFDVGVVANPCPGGGHP